MKQLFKKLNLIDWMNFIYFFYITILIVFFHSRIPYWRYALIFHTLYIILIIFLAYSITPQSHKILVFFRYFYHLFFITLLYKETELFMHVFHNSWMDPVVTQIELMIFKVHPTHWLQQFASPWLTEYMKFVYFTYFLLLPFFSFYLYLKKNHEGFYHYLFTITLALFLCYIGFMIVPVEGPRYYWSLFRFPHKIYYFDLIRNAQHYIYPVQLKGYFFTNLVNHIMAGGDATGACIPSAHNAAATVFLFMSKKYLKKGFYLFIPLVISIYISTVYNHYHYVTDMITGIITGLLAVYIGERLFKKPRMFIRD